MTDGLVNSVSGWEALRVWLSSTTGILMVAFIPPILLQLLFISLSPFLSRASEKRYKRAILSRIKHLSRCIAAVESGTDIHRLLLATVPFMVLAVGEGALAVFAVVFMKEGMNLVPLITAMQSLISSVLVLAFRRFIVRFNCMVLPRAEIKKLKTSVNVKNSKLLTPEERKVINAYLDRLSRQTRKSLIFKLNGDTHASVEAFFSSHDQPHGLSRIIEHLEKTDLGTGMSQAKISEVRSE